MNNTRINYVSHTHKCKPTFAHPCIKLPSKSCTDYYAMKGEDQVRVY